MPPYLKPFHYIFFRCVWTRRMWVRADAECCGRYQGLSYFVACIWALRTVSERFCISKNNFLSECKSDGPLMQNKIKNLWSGVLVVWWFRHNTMWTQQCWFDSSCGTSAVYHLSLSLFLFTSCLSLQLSTRRKKLGMLVWDNKLWKTPEVKTVK